MKRTRLFLGTAFLALTMPMTLLAREELVTLPDREGVSLTIYNSVDLTLVAERRTMSFVKGSNKLSFSWAGTLIDPTSVIFRALDRPDAIDVLDTSFPGESNQMLIWNIEAEQAGDYKVEISYFTSGISWRADYEGVLNADSSAMDLTSYITVMNNSGEEYENANVRVVIGTLNLVEQIRDLAQGGSKLARKEAAMKDFRRAEEKMERSRASQSNAAKQIEKDELGEYYIYAIGGEETVPNGWAKRLRSFEKKAVPLESVYTFQPAKYGHGLRRVYTFKNDKAHKLGEEPLPEGTVRFYQRKEGDGLGFVASLFTKYIPNGDEVKIAGEPDPNVTMEVKAMAYRKRNLSFHVGGGQRWVNGWDDETDYAVVLKNFTDRPARFEIHLSFQGDFTVRAGADTDLTEHDAWTRKLAVTVQPGAAFNGAYTLTLRQGTNAKR